MTMAASNVAALGEVAGDGVGVLERALARVRERELETLRWSVMASVSSSSG